MRRLATRARVLVCVDDLANVDDLSAAAQKYKVTIECLVEIDVGAGRCGVKPGEAAVEIAKKIDRAPGLKFAGLQAYQGKAQHVYDYPERKAMIDAAIADVANTVELLKAAGLRCDIVAGAGTGTFRLEGTSNVYNELQCGSYMFMDADYQRVRDEDGNFLSEFENSLFIYTTVMSKAKADKAICDAGLKAQSVDSGMPVIFGRERCQVHQVFRRARRDRRSGQRAEAQREAEADFLALRSHGQRLRLVRLRPERPCRGDLAGDGARDESLAAFFAVREWRSPSTGCARERRGK